MTDSFARCPLSDLGNVEDASRRQRLESWRKKRQTKKSYKSIRDAPPVNEKKVQELSLKQKDAMKAQRRLSTVLQLRATKGMMSSQTSTEDGHLESSSKENVYPVDGSSPCAGSKRHQSTPVPQKKRSLKLTSSEGFVKMVSSDDGNKRSTLSTTGLEFLQQNARRLKVKAKAERLGAQYHPSQSQQLLQHQPLQWHKEETHGVVSTPPPQHQRPEQVRVNSPMPSSFLQPGTLALPAHRSVPTANFTHHATPNERVTLSPTAPAPVPTHSHPGEVLPQCGPFIDPAVTHFSPPPPPDTPPLGERLGSLVTVARGRRSKKKKRNTSVKHTRRSIDEIDEMEASGYLPSINTNTDAAKFSKRRRVTGVGSAMEGLSLLPVDDLMTDAGAASPDATESLLVDNLRVKLAQSERARATLERRLSKEREQARETEENLFGRLEEATGRQAEAERELEDYKRIAEEELSNRLRTIELLEKDKWSVEEDLVTVLKEVDLAKGDIALLRKDNKILEDKQEESETTINYLESECNELRKYLDGTGDLESSMKDLQSYTLALEKRASKLKHALDKSLDDFQTEQAQHKKELEETHQRHVGDMDNAIRHLCEEHQVAMVKLADEKESEGKAIRSRVVKELEATRFHHHVLLQRCAESRGKLVERMQDLNKEMDEMEQIHDEEQAQLRDTLHSQVASLREKMSVGIQASVLKITELQEALKVEKEKNKAK
eukprot:TRINITY_DN6904_c0_g1_i1.p1 TRINITY_DN6904_c0_g1~~TRINITY_DN6904_c0_g1_i1.p1  ORF type:complete len:772 (-),score=166.43 TRINITY_DN6904_c0_g1_i1:11-2167(-)